MSNQNPIELARLAVNKTIVPKRKGRGRRGYGRRPAVRLFVYAQLKGIYKDEQLERHLKKNLGVARALGLKGVPNRTTIGRWKRRLELVVREALEKLACIVATLVPTELLVVDSTPLEDWRDPQARVGFYSRGPFKGFKVHVAVDQLGLSRKALITPGNRHDSPFLPELITGQRAKFVLGDAGHDSKRNLELACEHGFKPVIKPRSVEYHGIFRKQMLREFKRCRKLYRQRGIGEVFFGGIENRYGSDEVQTARHEDRKHPPYGRSAQPAHPRARPRDEGNGNFGYPMDLFDKPTTDKHLLISLLVLGGEHG